MPIYRSKSKKTSYFFKTSIYGRAFIRRGFKTRAEARTAEEQFRKELLGESVHRRCNEYYKTYKELLNEYGNYLKSNFKATYSIEQMIKISNYYEKLLPDVKIYKLTKADAMRLRKKIDKEDVKSSTKNNKLNFIKRFFSWVRDNYNFNYKEIFLLDKFKDYEISHVKRKDPIIEFSQFKEIYNKCNDEYYRLALLTMFLYGFRIGEQLALTVSSFDFKSKTIEIYQAVNFKRRTGKKGFLLVTPKTTASKRINSMPDVYVDIIKKYINEHKLKRNDFIFFRNKEEKNIPAHENTFRRHLEEICKKYNPAFHPHMLRKSIVTILRNRGVPIEDISNYIGHENSNITEEYYLKQSKEKEKKLDQILSQMIKEII